MQFRLSGRDRSGRSAFDPATDDRSGTEPTPFPATHSSRESGALRIERALACGRSQEPDPLHSPRTLAARLGNYDRSESSCLRAEPLLSFAPDRSLPSVDGARGRCGRSWLGSRVGTPQSKAICFPAQQQVQSPPNRLGIDAFGPAPSGRCVFSSVPYRESRNSDGGCAPLATPRCTQRSAAASTDRIAATRRGRS